MQNIKLKHFILGTILAGGITLGISSCSEKEEDEKQPNTEVKSPIKKQDKYDNIALFERSRSEIKFALAFVENYHEYIYWCGKSWTAGHGLTILYNKDGTSVDVNKNTKVPTITESDIYKGRYLTHDILPDIQKYIKVPMDQNTLIAACVLRYCIGHENFKNSLFLKELNKGKKGAELALTLSGWRKQDGIPKRCYFFAAIMAGKMQFSDLLTLRAEGCYNLKQKDIFVYVNGKPKSVANGLYEWDYSKLEANLEKAREPRKTLLNLGNRKYIHVDCKLTQDIVPDYIWNEVSHNAPKIKEGQQTNIAKTPSADEQNDISYIAYQEQDFATALNAGKIALQLAETNKQKGAACYNIGITYIEIGKYSKAIKYLNESLAFNQTKAAKDALQIATEKHQRSCHKAMLYVGLGALGCGGALYARKKYLMQKQRY